MPRTIWYCLTNSGHEHSTEWEAENCSQLYIALRDCQGCLEDGQDDMAYDNVVDDLIMIEAR